MPVDIRNCRRCHKLFNNMGNGVCPDCIRELDDIFVKVRDFLYDNPRASIDEMCEATGATEANIVGWLREGRLIVGGDGPKLLKCEGCGSSIASGRYCASCSYSVQTQLSDTARALQPPPRDFVRSKEDNEKGLHVDVSRRR